MSAGSPAVPRAVYVVVPEGVDDGLHPSGGNVYDRRVCHGLAALGWAVAERPSPGGWPRPAAGECARLAKVIGTIPDGSLVLLDGLIACAAPLVLAPEASRLRLVALVHMPLGTGSSDRETADAAEAAEVRCAEAAALGSCRAVIATSHWTRRRLLARYPLRPAAVHVAEPGADAAPPAPASPSGDRLLCVATVAPHKGHDVLLTALGGIGDLGWTCTCVGALDRDPAFVDAMRRNAAAAGLDGRIRFVGPRTGPGLDAVYAAADLLVLASRAESYGMVLTEALARGVPLVATSVGGVPEAVGPAVGGQRPGLLVPADDVGALQAALRAWLTDAELRGRLRLAAGRRRGTLADWSVTAGRIARVLSEVAA